MSLGRVLPASQTKVHTPSRIQATGTTVKSQPLHDSNHNKWENNSQYVYIKFVLQLLGLVFWKMKVGDKKLALNDARWAVFLWALLLLGIGVTL